MESFLNKGKDQVMKTKEKLCQKWLFRNLLVCSYHTPTQEHKKNKRGAKNIQQRLHQPRILLTPNYHPPKSVEHSVRIKVRWAPNNFHELRSSKKKMLLLSFGANLVLLQHAIDLDARMADRPKWRTRLISNPSSLQNTCWVFASSPL